MNEFIFPEDVTEVIGSFLWRNKGDDATEALILSIGAELLDVSPDKLLEMLDKEGGAV